jgi:translation initiation factor 3 subunit G
LLCSLKDILYKKRMERELLRAKGLLKEAEKAPEDVSNPLTNEQVPKTSC